MPLHLFILIFIALAIIRHYLPWPHLYSEVPHSLDLTLAYWQLISKWLVLLKNYRLCALVVIKSSWSQTDRKMFPSSILWFTEFPSIQPTQPRKAKSDSPCISHPQWIHTIHPTPLFPKARQILFQQVLVFLPPRWNHQQPNQCSPKHSFLV